MNDVITEIGWNGYWTGRSRAIAPDSGAPRGWTRAPLPELGDGEYAAWNNAGAWTVRDRPPAPAAPAPMQVPEAVTMRQARLYLLSKGRLQDVEAALDALPEPQRTAANIEWEYSQEVQRHNTFVNMLAPILSWTDADLDTMFIEADKL